MMTTLMCTWLSNNLPSSSSGEEDGCDYACCFALLIYKLFICYIMRSVQPYACTKHWKSWKVMSEQCYRYITVVNKSDSTIFWNTAQKLQALRQGFIWVFSLVEFRHILYINFCRRYLDRSEYLCFPFFLTECISLRMYVLGEWLKVCCWKR